MYTSSKSTNTKPMDTISVHMFQAINVNRDKSSYSINAKSLGTISYAIDIDRKLITINAKPMCTFLNLFIKTKNDFSLVVISTESLYQLSILLYVRLQLGLNSVITSYALYI